MPATGSSPGTSQRVSVVVAPRERFDLARRSLESIFEHTAEGTPIIYPEANVPRRLRRWLGEQDGRPGFERIEFDRYLAPNEARNAGFARTSTEYVVFADNDVLASPGWVEAMERCADDTDASLVAPLTYEGDFFAVHVATGELEIREEVVDGREIRRLHERLDHRAERVTPEDLALTRQRTSFAEPHCFLVRSEFLRELGGFDERVLSTRDHIDLCLSVDHAGGTIWFEPAAVVSALAGADWDGETPFPPLSVSSVPFYALRWSDEWHRRTLTHLQRKWDLPDDEGIHRRLANLGWRRREAIVRPIVRRLTLGRGSRRLERVLFSAERRLNRLHTRNHDRLQQNGAGDRGSIGVRS